TYFRIPELGNQMVTAEREFDPVVIMTNNSEKSLPDAFLRRCIYYHIPFPSGARLEQIALARLPEYVSGSGQPTLLRDAVSFTQFIREPTSGLEKRPGTAELLNWLSAMVKLGANRDANLAEPGNHQIALRAFPALIKISGDQDKVVELLGAWSNARGS